jgi:hypothetical protein
LFTDGRMIIIIPKVILILTLKMKNEHYE